MCSTVFGLEVLSVLYRGRSGKQLLNNCAVWLLKISYQSIEEGNFNPNDRNISRKNFRYDVYVMQIRLCVVTVALSAYLAVSSPELRIPLCPSPRTICRTPSVLLTILIFVTNRTACLLRHTPWDSPVL